MIFHSYVSLPEGNQYICTTCNVISGYNWIVVFFVLHYFPSWSILDIIFGFSTVHRISVCYYTIPSCFENLCFMMFYYITFYCIVLHCIVFSNTIIIIYNIIVI